MKIAAALPENHGLNTILDDLIAAPEDEHLVVASIDCSRLTTDVDTGKVEPTVRIVGVEVITDDKSLAAAQRLFLAAKDARNGQSPLGFDATTGEVDA